MTAPPPVAPEMKIALHYNGLEVDRGRMSAVDLGPAILGLSTAFGETSRVLYGADARVRVEIDADFEHASFGLEFFLVAPGSPGLLTPDSMQQLANTVTVLMGGLGLAGIVTKGVLWLIKAQAGKKVVRTERQGDQVVIEFEGNVIESVTINEYHVYTDPEVRKGLRAIVAPLEREGIDTLTVKPEDREAVVLTKADVPQFDAIPLADEEITVSVSEVILEVISPVFLEDGSWRFAQGEAVFHAKISDKDFLAGVADHKWTFGRGDALRVDMETRTTRVGGQLKYSRTVLRVHEKLSGGTGEQFTLV